MLRARMPELDGVRGVAVLMVLLYHGFYWAVPEGVGPLRIWPLYQAARAGWLGVQLFFVLSGFLITGILLEARGARGYWRTFYDRRARRILPAYLVLLLVLWLSHQSRPGFLLASLLFAANLSPLFGIRRDYPPLWSLAVEEQFYLLWPFVVRWASRRVLAATCAALLVATPLLRWLAFRRGDIDGLYYHTWHNMDALAAGGLLALLLRHPSATVERVRRVASGVVRWGAAAIGIALVTGWLTTRVVADTPGDALVRNTLWALWCAGAIALLLALGRGAWGARLRIAPLEFAGHISYGLYLVQVLAFRAFDALVSPPPGAATIFMIARFLVAGAASVAVATLSRRTLEEWFLRRPGPTGGAGHADGSPG